MSSKVAFSIVELLVIVSILMVVSGIALMSWDTAITRTKVARVQADFRSLETALDSYFVDNNSYARMRHADFYQDINLDRISRIPVNGILSTCLSTPVAYMTNVSFLDPFTVGLQTVALDEQFYTYQVITEYVKFLPQSKFWPEARAFYGDWRLMSSGPDSQFNHYFANSAQLPYDSTNGTHSLGNIIYSKRQHGFSKLPPIPILLGKH